METRLVQSYEEVVKLFPLFHRYFDRAETDYTEKEFFDSLPFILKEGVIGYVEEDGTPVAYGIMLKTRLLREYALILQVYSERRFAVRHMKRMADEITRAWGVDKQISIVGPKVALYFARFYNMKTTFFVMERNIEEVEEAVV